jgi:hypothetical protein
VLSVWLNVLRSHLFFGLHEKDPTMGWLFMIFNIAAVGALYGMQPPTLFGVALALLAISFTTFCLLYDEPLKRAQHRVAQQLGQISGKGMHAEEHQRLQSMKITPNESDRKFRFTPMSGVNVASGIGGAILLAWGLLARLT